MRLIYIIVYFKVENNFITLQLSQPMSHVSEERSGLAAWVPFLLTSHVKLLIFVDFQQIGFVLFVSLSSD